MQKMKKLAFGAANGLLLLAPAMASAQLTQGNWAGATGRGQANAISSGLPTGSIYDIISSTLSWLLAILGFIAVIGFVISGILYLTAAGDETQAEKAKNAMTYSIIGVIVALMGYVIIQAVAAWLGTAANF
ncbi:MAG: pilin [Candidatus Moraniibacteriota bacterium]